MGRSDRIVRSGRTERVAFKHEFQRVAPLRTAFTKNRQPYNGTGQQPPRVEISPGLQPSVLSGNRNVNGSLAPSFNGSGRPTTVPVKVGDRTVDRRQLTWFVGPSTIISPEQIVSVASTLSRLEVRFLRSRVASVAEHLPDPSLTSLRLLRAAADRFKLKVVCEIEDHRHIRLMYPMVDVFEVGLRNSGNFGLLAELGRTDKTVLLNCCSHSSLDEILTAVEYLERGHVANIILAVCAAPLSADGDSCFDVATIVKLSAATRYPVLANCADFRAPEHQSFASFVERMTAAVVGAGAMGVIAEVAEGDIDLTATNGHVSPSPGLSLEELECVMKRTFALRYTLDAISHSGLT